MLNFGTFIDIWIDLQPEEGIVFAGDVMLYEDGETQMLFENGETMIYEDED